MGGEPCPGDLQALHERASRPSAEVVEALRPFPGRVVVLGAGGKMGWHLCRMVQRAQGQLPGDRSLLAVSRFGDAEAERPFREAGIALQRADLTDPAQVAELPEAGLVFFLAGIKFGTAGSPGLLRRFNVEMPRLVGERYRGATVAALSSGCVYPFVRPETGGSRETDPADPPGDYARSCLGREEAFRESSVRHGTPVVLIRLNYAIDLRYGVLVDIARRVWAGQPVDVRTGWVNVIWQGDAVAAVIRAAGLADCPPAVLNVTGARMLRVREVARRLGDLLGRPAQCMGEEAETAWLNDASRLRGLFGPGEIDEETLLVWVADWVRRGGPFLDKPTHFETRDGKF